MSDDEGRAVTTVYPRITEQPTSAQIEPCPCCGGRTAVFEVVDEPGAEVTRAVMCDSGMVCLVDGEPMYCPFDLPPRDFYYGRAADAIKHWNEYAKALSALRRKNNWSRAHVLRGEEQA